MAKADIPGLTDKPDAQGVGGPEQPSPRFATIHVGDHQSPGHTVRLHPHPEKPGVWRVQPEDQAQALKALSAQNQGAAMPLNDKGEKIMGAMKQQYGPEKGKRVFYASKNKGTISEVEAKGEEPEEDDEDDDQDEAAENRDLIGEHKRLVKVLRSKSQADNEVEAKKQAKELREYQEKDRTMAKAVLFTRCSAALRRLIAKAEQLSLFGSSGEVKEPGKRGGKYYRTDAGKVRYGQRPTGGERRPSDRSQHGDVKTAQGTWRSPENCPTCGLTDLMSRDHQGRMSCTNCLTPRRHAPKNWGTPRYGDEVRAGTSEHMGDLAGADAEPQKGQTKTKGRFAVMSETGRGTNEMHEQQHATVEEAEAAAREHHGKTGRETMVVHAGGPNAGTVVRRLPRKVQEAGPADAQAYDRSHASIHRTGSASHGSQSVRVTPMQGVNDPDFDKPNFEVERHQHSATSGGVSRDVPASGLTLHEARMKALSLLHPEEHEKRISQGKAEEAELGSRLRAGMAAEEKQASTPPAAAGTLHPLGTRVRLKGRAAHAHHTERAQHLMGGVHTITRPALELNGASHAGFKDEGAVGIVSAHHHWQLPGKEPATNHVVRWPGGTHSIVGGDYLEAVGGTRGDSEKSASSEPPPAAASSKKYGDLDPDSYDAATHDDVAKKYGGPMTRSGHAIAYGNFGMLQGDVRKITGHYSAEDHDDAQKLHEKTHRDLVADMGDPQRIEHHRSMAESHAALAAEKRSGGAAPAAPSPRKKRRSKVTYRSLGKTQRGERVSHADGKESPSEWMDRHDAFNEHDHNDAAKLHDAAAGHAADGRQFERAKYHTNMAEAHRKRAQAVSLTEGPSRQKGPPDYAETRRNFQRGNELSHEARAHVERANEALSLERRPEPIGGRRGGGTIAKAFNLCILPDGRIVRAA